MRTNPLRLFFWSLALLPVTVTAAALGEPENGFIHGRNVEWNAVHMASFEKTEHRLFHADWEEREREWLASTERDAIFDEQQRVWTSERNRQHRRWHRSNGITGDTELVISRRHLLRTKPEEEAPLALFDAVESGSGETESTSEGTITPEVPDTENADSPTGRISRRQIRAAAIARREAERRLAAK